MEPMPDLSTNVEYARGGVVRRGDYGKSTAEILTQLEERVVNGRFRLLRWLGGSRTSAVYLTAFDGTPPRMAALKLVAASEPDAEIRLTGWNVAARFSHKNLMEIIDCGRCEIDRNAFVYLVTEYSDEILEEVLPGRPLTPVEAREMLEPVLNALEYMHARGYVHGRIKPSNLLVVNDRLKLSPDSTAIAAGCSAEHAESVAYDAPELGRGAVTPAVDVWALGMTLVAALTQRTARWEPWSGQEPTTPAGIPEPFGQIAKACLRVDPAERCKLDEIRAILDPAHENKMAPPLATRMVMEAKPQRPTRRAGSWRAALISVVALGAVAGAALIVRTREFPANRANSSDSPAAAASVQSPVAQAGKADFTPTQTKLNEQSPSGSHGIAGAPGTQTIAEPASVSSGGESNGVLLRVNPKVEPAAQKSIRGQVNVTVRIKTDTAGNITDAALESRSGSNYFNRVALDAARQWRFAALPSETAATGTWSVHFEFRQDGIDAGATRE